MCGITGIYNFDGASVSKELLKRMTDKMIHRGPEGEGYYLSGNAGLGHRRLRIIDLSEAGSQPMCTRDKRFWISYNGEIYNFKEIKKKLKEKGHTFKSTTDTEIILYSFKEWGVECIAKFDGMFAFSIWDDKKKKGILARDRYGIKPAYYYEDKKKFVFASEIKALLEHPDINVELDYNALNEYFTFQNILSEKTLFKGIKLLKRGSFIQYGEKGLNTKKYWNYDFSTQDMTEEEAIKSLKNTFERAVKRQMISDVPVASYLSGGMDSGSITTLAAKNSDILRTFTCGFDMTSVEGYESQFDERERARKMSELFKTEHREIEVSPDDMHKLMKNVVYHLEDLRLGMSFPNYSVAKFVSKHNKVVLSGTGGDELFCGYPWRYRNAIGNKSRDDYVRKYHDYWQRLVKDDQKNEFFTPRALKKIKNTNTKKIFTDLFLAKELDYSDNEECINNALKFESETFLQGLFIVEDKLSMAHSLESRVPFLDNNLVDLAMKIPLEYKLKNYEEIMSIGPEQASNFRKEYVESTNGKYILRKAMSEFIPEEIAYGKKQGFSAPVAEWFRKDSKEYVEKILLSEKCLSRDVINPEYIKKTLREHYKGNDKRLLIWSLLCFENWCRVWIDGEKP